MRRWVARVVFALMALSAGIVIMVPAVAPAAAVPTGSSTVPSPGPAGPPAESPNPTLTPTVTESPTPPPAAGPVTVAVGKNCDSYSIDATVGNGGSSPVTVGVVRDGPVIEIGAVFASVTVAGGQSGLLRVTATFSDSYHLVYIRLDTGTEVGRFDEDIFMCAHRYDHRVVVVSGTTYVGRDWSCPVYLGVTSGPAHGRAHPTAGELIGESLAYTPDRGYVGPDQLDYACNASAEAFGTVFITVVPAPAGRHAPPAGRHAPPARPALPVPSVRAAPAPPTGLATTGMSGLPLQFAVGCGLVLAGVLGLWLSRRTD
jgi:hypothetical protein